MGTEDIIENVLMANLTDAIDMHMVDELAPGFTRKKSMAFQVRKHHI